MILRAIIAALVIIGAWELYGSTVANTSCPTGGISYAVSGQQLPYDKLCYTPTTMNWTVQIAPGSYTVTLRFIEPRTVQGRLFSVSINGTVVIPSLDLFVVAGALTPKDFTFPVTSTGTVTVLFASITGNAVVSAVSVDTIPPPLNYGLESAIPAACPAGGVSFYGATDTKRLFWCAPGLPWSHVWEGVIAPPPAGIPLVGTMVPGTTLGALVCLPPNTRFGPSTTVPLIPGTNGMPGPGAIMLPDGVQANCVLP